MKKKEWIKSLRCVICLQSGVDPHHVKTVGAGGGDADLVPLCRLHHQEFHDMGRETFSHQHNIDLPRMAKLLHDHWAEYHR